MTICIGHNSHGLNCHAKTEVNTAHHQQTFCQSFLDAGAACNMGLLHSHYQTSWRKAVTALKIFLIRLK